MVKGGVADPCTPKKENFHFNLHYIANLKRQKNIYWFRLVPYNLDYIHIIVVDKENPNIFIHDQCLAKAK